MDPHVEAASRRFPHWTLHVDDLNYFDPKTPCFQFAGNLPHWRQEGTIYFVTFRTADSLPQQKLSMWVTQRDEWLRSNPAPHNNDQKTEYWELFPERIQSWLDAGFGQCLLKRTELREIVVRSMEHFEGVRYLLRDWIVMPNHVHVLVAPLEPFDLSEVVQTWKSFTAKEINKRLGRTGAFWQKEYFDHIVRSVDSLARLEQYIEANPNGLPEGAYTWSGKRNNKSDGST